ncbi:MAG TPA: tubulin-like doman-containing protein [Gemmataceae bacterium]|nr:tubulin-like doman-containing protein [Gemmataceae bacterium]
MAVRIESQAEPIPGYRLIERLGGGGFGEVWKAEAPGGFLKAIKFVYGDLQDVGEDGIRAEQELKALARVKSVRHPYILSLERFDIVDGQLLIVMELADRNLWDRFKECRSLGLPGIPREELLGYMEEAAEALDLMNIQYQLQHLDIKPQNLFLVHNHVKIADFGLVKDLEGRSTAVTGGVTPVYAAPETFDGWVSRFSDQYSLAIVFMELLTGQRPFPGNNIRQLVVQHMQGKPDLSALPPEDRPVIERALAKNPDDRYPTCRALVEGLWAATLNRKGQPETREVLKPTEDLDSDGPLTTPNRVTPDFSTGTTQWLRNLDSQRSVPTVTAPASLLPPEMSGDGALFPSLVVALGSQGLSVLQQLREHLVEKFGSLEALPQLRLLFVDTDPEVLRTATKGTLGTALTAGEIFLAQLNRPSHYLRPRDGRLPIESWFNPKMLYRIPRTQVTTGVRALGRLAFGDNYRSILRRLRLELSACLNPEALATAVAQTGLGLRSNRPRVYVITGLAGGTGSGMFIDLAYAIRALLRELGYDQPDMVGVFIVPATDRQRVRTMSLGNTFAALAELYHFATPGQEYTARFDEREPPLRDSSAAFNRSVVLRLPDEADPTALRQVAGLAGEFLYRDLCSPMGRTIDLARAERPGPPWAQRGQYCQTFGLFRFSWPRRAMTEQAARRLCQNLVRQWMSKDSKAVRDQVYNFVQEQWAKQRLGPEHFAARLEAACEKAHGQAIEPVFAALAEEPVRAPSGESRPSSTGLGWSPSLLREAVQKIHELLGRPGDEGTVGRSGPLVEALRKASEELIAQWGQKLAELVVRLIERPNFRLAGAEEAIRQAIALIEQILDQQEQAVKDLAERAAETFQRIHALIEQPLRGAGRRVGGSTGRRGPASPAEVAELLHGYARLRFQSLVVNQVIAAYLSLRGHLSDELREVNFCRVRMGELLQAFEVPEEGKELRTPDLTAEPSRQAAESVGRSLFPHGCRTLEEAVEQFLAEITPGDLQELDGRIQAMIRQQFTALVHVCLSSSGLLKGLEAAMMQEAKAFVESRLTATDAAEMFLTQFPDEEQAKAEIVNAFHEAVPQLVVAGRGAGHDDEGICVVAAPSGPAGERFRQLACEALPDVEITDGVSSDDLIIYREWPNLPLTDLEQFGPVGREAYRQMTSVEHFTPHTRIDIVRWNAPGTDRPAPSPLPLSPAAGERGRGEGAGSRTRPPANGESRVAPTGQA